MNKLKLMIADCEESFCTELSHLLQGQYIIKTCSDGLQALELLYAFVPDILVLDVMLPSLDGITLLQKAAQQGFRPSVIVMSSYYSEYIANAASHFEVSYMMRKPCCADACAARIDDISQGLLISSAPRSDARTQVTGFLLQLGISAKRKGYAYLREGILLFSQDMSQMVTKELYPAIAAKFSSSRDQVERAIRSAIQNAWKVRDCEIWGRYFSQVESGSCHCPTNGEFIARLSDYLILCAEAQLRE